MSNPAGHRFTIRGVEVDFPCKPYPSQFSVMDKVITGLKNRTHSLLESPTGSGKSLALLCATLAWQRHHQRQLNESGDGVCYCVCHFREAASDGEGTEVEKKERGKKEKRSRKDREKNGESSKSSRDEVDDDEDFKKPVVKKLRSKVRIEYEDDDEDEDDRDKNDDHNSHDAQELEEDADSEKENKREPCHCCETPGRPFNSTKVVDETLGGKKKDAQQDGPAKIYYGSRTHKQIAQLVRELKKTVYRGAKMTILASRDQTCVEPDVVKSKNRNEGCNEMLRRRKRGDMSGSCPYYENGTHLTHRVLAKSGLTSGWDLEDLVKFGRRRAACPFFGAKALREEAEIVLCPYNYLIDPLIRDSLEINLSGHVIILDEAHNMEDTAREAASAEFGLPDLEDALDDVAKFLPLGILVEEHARMQLLLKQLIALIHENSNKLEQRSWDLESKVLSGEATIEQLSLKGVGPSAFKEMRKSMRKVASENSDPQGGSPPLLSGSEPTSAPPRLHHSTVALLKNAVIILAFLFRDDCVNVVDYKTVVKRARRRPNARSFRRRSGNSAVKTGEWLSTSAAGGGGGGGGDDEDFEYKIQFLCLNPAVAFTNMARGVRSIILASGTLSPMDSFQSELGLNFDQQLEANHVIKDGQVLVSTVGQAPSGVPLKATHQNTDGLDFQDGLGDLVRRICERTAHGVLCFLPSYSLLNKLLKRWRQTGLVAAFEGGKRVFVEPRGGDKDEFDRLLTSFYSTIECTNSGPAPNGQDGALLFAVCRGKVSEGMDFTDNNARAVITVGIPFPSFVDTAVMEKKKYNNFFASSRRLLSGDKWYEIQAYRALNQALGRCLRHRLDWGALVLVDSRFKENPQRYISGLSKWVKSKVVHFDSCVDFLRELESFQTARRREAAAAAAEAGGAAASSSMLDATTTTKQERPLHPMFTTPSSSSRRNDAAASTSAYFPTPEPSAFLDGASRAASEEEDDVVRAFARMKEEVEREKRETEREKRETEREKRETEKEKIETEKERKEKGRKDEEFFFTDKNGKRRFDWRAKRAAVVAGKGGVGVGGAKVKAGRKLSGSWLCVSAEVEGENSVRRLEEEEEEEKNIIVIIDDDEDNNDAVVAAAAAKSGKSCCLLSDATEAAPNRSRSEGTLSAFVEAPALLEAGREEVGFESLPTGESRREIQSLEQLITDVDDVVQVAPKTSSPKRRNLFPPPQTKDFGLLVDEPLDRVEADEDASDGDRSTDLFLDDDDDELCDFFVGGDDDLGGFLAQGGEEKTTTTIMSTTTTTMTTTTETSSTSSTTHSTDRRNAKRNPSSSPDKDFGSRIAETPSPVVASSTKTDATDNPATDNPAPTMRRRSLKRLKMSAKKADVGRDDSIVEEENLSPCPPSVFCLASHPLIFSRGESFRPLREFSLPRLDSSADAFPIPADCRHRADPPLLTRRVQRRRCFRVSIDAAASTSSNFSPLISPGVDAVTGLPAALWSEELGCALRALRCRMCESGTVAALEILSDSYKIKKGEFICVRDAVRVCPRLVDQKD